jgi:hypothetical protein
MSRVINVRKGESMNRETEISGRDETLASCLYYTGIAESPPFLPPIRLVSFEYTIRHKILLEEVRTKFGDALTRELPPEHRALLERGEEQSPEDIALATRMREVQRDALMA